MKDGYIRAAAAAPFAEMADCAENVKHIKELIEKAAASQVKLLVLPELCITGYSLGDLFLQQTLLNAAERSLCELISFSHDYDMLIVVGMPFRHESKLYNCAAIIKTGKLLGLVPKSHIPNYNEFYEARHFSSGKGITCSAFFGTNEIAFGTDLIFTCENLPNFKLGIEICEDLWVPVSPSSKLALEGATVIANISASPYVTGKAFYRKMIVTAQSGRCICGYVYSSCGAGESSTDLVYSGHLMIAENGRMLSEIQGDGELIISDIDTQLIASERRRMTTFSQNYTQYTCRHIPFNLKPTEYKSLFRAIERRPFVPVQDELYKERCHEVLDIQSAGLAKRLRHTKASAAVVAVSGGLDSTLALLVIKRAIKKYKLDCAITAITMPGPGTTGRTRGNADALCRAIGAQMKTIPIANALTTHLADIGHNGDPDTAYENAQARERTQIAMSVANMQNGLVIGTGDMSELALGFTTYNGDHMSMYGVNAGVPKTLVRHLIKYVADENSDNTLLHETLYDILDTPVSPELLPALDDKITQITEDILGPYELHDFFLYYFLRFGFEPTKILRLAVIAFNGTYEENQIKTCLINFIKRFFASQFKRSCIPDGPKVGAVALSPRGDLRMPSDASCTEWLKQLQ